ncbi:MAG: transcription termination factor Rho [Acidimicrobiaceae bacterium]|nr:transcription termination factor Rho [Acidimicrobiaceae bacterium]MCY4280718.1 transcription termination factor Rho [Acidimicrobiaceae bacterium]MCY4294167.1 transcription termination factor Rho [Acidimicrobiaceae bacterium]
MEATEMRRSTLQRKDRSELNQIAAALGARPSSRARKDEIIQMIIDLTAGGGSAPPAARGPSDAPHAADDFAVPGDASSRPSAEPDPTARPDDQEGEDQEGENENVNGGAGEAPVGDSDAMSGSERVEDEMDTGNRRRRRRSRDRDRDRDDGWDGDPVAVSGRLDLRDEGYGFLRVDGCLPNRNDAYVAVKTIRQFGLRRGDHLTGTSRPANRTEKNPALLTLESINGEPAGLKDRPLFDEMTPIHAGRRLGLAQAEDAGALTTRLIDLIAPVGVGQRVLVKGPRRSGVTGVLTALVAAIEMNEPDIFVMALFLDQRPEDVTEVRRCVHNGEVAATTFDQNPEDHVLTAEMTIERAKRLVESGMNVAVVVDSLTALAQAYNSAFSSSGRSWNNSIESGAVHMPKKLFGSGRNISEGGSLTMIASLATGGAGPLSEVLSDEFLGAANTEVCLDRWAARLGLFPAVDVLASVSRDADRFLDADEVEKLQRLRRSLVDGPADHPTAVVEALKTMLSKLNDSASNAELLV